MNYNNNKTNRMLENNDGNSAQCTISVTNP